MPLRPCESEAIHRRLYNDVLYAVMGPGWAVEYLTHLHTRGWWLTRFACPVRFLGSHTHTVDSKVLALAGGTTLY